MAADGWFRFARINTYLGQEVEAVRGFREAVLAGTEDWSPGFQRWGSIVSDWLSLEADWRRAD